MQPQLKESRRLTGANLFWDLPAAVIDVSIPGRAADLIDAWSLAARDLLARVGRPDEQLAHRVFAGGASLLISAPIDALYSMCELNELAWQAATAALSQGEPPNMDAGARRLRGLFDGERNPPLLALQAAARKNDVPFLWDDDAVSVGYGGTALVWTPDRLPAPERIDWGSIGSIPRIGDTILDTGDYSGTGGARTLMRHPATEVAVLETARGGLLRRGLGIERANAALITNVAADHLGEYGINTVAELLEAKFIVRRALEGDAPLILNADDPGIVAYARELEQPIAWFGLNPGLEPLRSHLAAGKRAAYLEDGWLHLGEGGNMERIAAVAELPATLGGAARHNVSNALGAALLCRVLGTPPAAIREGLAGFRGDEQDNPGRGNWFAGKGVRVLVDFAHNEHGMQALAEMVRRVPSERIILLMGQAGDRLDKDIGDLTRAACGMGPARLVICELPGYERGRAPMETPKLIRSIALDAGVPDAAMAIHANPVEAAAEALGHARPGDLLVFLALTQRREVLDLVHGYLGTA
jgi:hypothetical protein